MEINDGIGIAASQARVVSKARFVPDPQARGDQQPFILSYLGMREVAGWVGVVLPLAVAVGNWPGHGRLEDSISAYYFTRMGAWFAGSLWVIGFFMASCRGYDKWDELSGRLAGCFALGVALIPMNNTGVKHGWICYRGWLHWACAAWLFIVLALTSLLLFTKSSSSNPTAKKELRNTWYRVCGWAILGCIALIGGYNLVGMFDQVLYERMGLFKPVFWLEAGAVVAFGVAWLVKGETFEFVRD
jgi:hypothetical protein